VSEVERVGVKAGEGAWVVEEILREEVDVVRLLVRGIG
jgi:hypothetical protein